MINKRGAIAASVFVAANIVLLSISLAFKLNGGRIWLIPIIVFAVTFLFSIMILMSVLRAGIDIKADMVIMPDLDPMQGQINMIEMAVNRMARQMSRRNWKRSRK